MEGEGVSSTPLPSLNTTSRSTDCLDLDSTCPGSLDLELTARVTPGSCSCYSDKKVSSLCYSDKLSPGGSARYRVRVREKMRKYHAVIRLNSSNSDVSTLDLSNLEESEALPENPALYYTIDSRRLATKHKKSLRERCESNSVFISFHPFCPLSDSQCFFSFFSFFFFIMYVCLKF